MNIHAEWEERAKQDGTYAIAIALQEVASALRMLGTWNAATEMGAIEFLAVHIGEKIEGLTGTIIETTELISNAIDRGAPK
jgi:hypothetical protein